MKKLKMIVFVSHVSLQSFNTLSFLSLHALGRVLGTKRFFLVCILQSLPLSRDSEVVGLTLFWSESVYVGGCPESISVLPYGTRSLILSSIHYT